MEKEHQFFITYEETKNWLQTMDIENYSIRDDLTVDIEGHVNIMNKKLEYIPVKFGNVTGYFDCDKNKLMSLKGAPNYVGQVFWCNNNNLTSLKNAPQIVGQDFYCTANKITILNDFLTKINGNFYCDSNPISDFNCLEFEVKDDICFTPIGNMDYLKAYKTDTGTIEINFNEFKRIQDLQKLNKKLTDDLSVKDIKIKHKI